MLSSIWDAICGIWDLVKAIVKLASSFIWLIFSLAGCLTVFFLTNIDAMFEFIVRMPISIQRGLTLVSYYINLLQSAILNISGIAPLAAPLAFLNSVFPVAELFSLIVSLCGLSILAFTIRLIFKFTIVFR